MFAELPETAIMKMHVKQNIVETGQEEAFGRKAHSSKQMGLGFYRWGGGYVLSAASSPTDGTAEEKQHQRKRG